MSEIGANRGFRQAGEVAARSLSFYEDSSSESRRRLPTRGHVAAKAKAADTAARRLREKKKGPAPEDAGPKAATVNLGRDDPVGRHAAAGDAGEVDGAAVGQTDQRVARCGGVQRVAEARRDLDAVALGEAEILDGVGPTIGGKG